MSIHSAFCNVATEKGILSCSLRGRLRLDDEKDVVAGDRVSVSAAEDFCIIEKVLDRTNLLKRPSVANVDHALVVCTATQPRIDFAHLDKLLVHLELLDVGATLCFNKSDIEDADTLSELAFIYRKAGYDTVITSAVTGHGVEELLDHLGGKITILAGASGVGKSKILRNLFDLDLETGRLSKTGRGRHTTKGVTLFPLKNGGYVADTPGFSRIDLFLVEPEELSYYYREFAEHIPFCHYPRCLHRTEDRCAVKDALGEGKIHQTRYETYLTLLDEALERMKQRYDGD